MKSTKANQVITGLGMDVKGSITKCLCDCLPCPPSAPTSASSLQSSAVSALGDANSDVMPAITIGSTK